MFEIRRPARRPGPAAVRIPRRRRRRSRPTRSGRRRGAARLLTIVPAPPGWARTRTTLCTGKPVSSEISLAGRINFEIAIETEIADHADAKPRESLGDGGKPCGVHHTRKAWYR